MQSVVGGGPPHVDESANVSIIGRLFKFFYGVIHIHDTAYMEFVHDLFVIMWGLWNIQPWIQVHTGDFAYVGSFDLSNYIAAWACFYGTVGMGILFYDRTDTTRLWRKGMALRLCCFWAIVMYLHVRNMYFSPSTIIYPLIMFGEAWIFWRIRIKNGTP